MSGSRELYFCFVNKNKSRITKNQKAMKKSSLYFLISILLTSCASTYQEIGSLSMLSNRSIEPSKNYKKLATAIGSSRKELKGATAESMDAAINSAINKVPGGKYLTNVKIYVVHGEYLAVSGDVWGQPENTQGASKLVIK
jgi:hypothetical protein